MVTITDIIVTGLYSTLVRFSSSLSDPTFYIYLDGNLIATTKNKEFTFGINLDESYMVEILDDADEEPVQVFPGKVRLLWYSVPETSYYRIDEKIASVWTEREKIAENDGYMEFQSRQLEDGLTHEFRIVPVGTNGNEGTAKEFAILCVRHPDVPDVSYAYSAVNRKVTIT